MWSRLGAKVTAVEFMNQIGGLGIDQEMAKSFQRILTKQHMQFKLGTKVLGAQKTGGKIIVNVENVKSAKQEEVRGFVLRGKFFFFFAEAMWFVNVNCTH